MANFLDALKGIFPGADEQALASGAQILQQQNPQATPEQILQAAQSNKDQALLPLRQSAISQVANNPTIPGASQAASPDPNATPAQTDIYNQLRQQFLQYSPEKRAEAQAKAEEAQKSIPLGIAEALSTFGRGLQGQSGPGEQFQKIRQNINDKYLGQFDQGRKDLMDRINFESTLGNLKRQDIQDQVSAAQRDPNSAESKALRASFLEQGIKVPENASMATLEANYGKVADVIKESRAHQAKLKEIAATGAEERRTKLLENQYKAPPQSEGQKKYDEEYAKDRAERDKTKGNFDSTMQKALSLANELENRGKGPGVSKFIPGERTRKLLNPEYAKLKERAYNLIRPQLRTSGLLPPGSASEQDRINAFNTIWDDSLDDKTNAAKIRDWVEGAYRNKTLLDKQDAYFDKSKFQSLQGFDAGQNRQFPPSGQQVKMLAPDGSARMVPIEKVQEAIDAGGSLAR